MASNRLSYERQLEIVMELMSTEEINRWTGLNLSPESLEFLEQYLEQEDFSESKSAQQEAVAPEVEAKYDSDIEAVKEFNKIARKLGKKLIKNETDEKKALPILKKYKEKLKAASQPELTSEGINEARELAHELVTKIHSEKFYPNSETKEVSIYEEPLTDEELNAFQKLIELNNIILPKQLQLNTKSIRFIRQLLNELQNKSDLDAVNQYFKQQCENNVALLCNDSPEFTNLTVEDLSFVKLLKLDQLITANNIAHVKSILTQCKAVAYEDTIGAEELSELEAYFDSEHDKVFSQSAVTVEELKTEKSSNLYPNLNEFKQLVEQLVEAGELTTTVTIPPKFYPTVERFAEILLKKLRENQAKAQNNDPIPLFKKIYKEVYLPLFAKIADKIDFIRKLKDQSVDRLKDLLLLISEKGITPEMVPQLKEKLINELRAKTAVEIKDVIAKTQSELDIHYQAQQTTLRASLNAQIEQYQKDLITLQSALTIEVTPAELKSIQQREDNVLQLITTCNEKIGTVASQTSALDTGRKVQYESSISQFKASLDSTQDELLRQKGELQKAITAITEIKKPEKLSDSGIHELDKSYQVSLADLTRQYNNCLQAIEEDAKVYIDNRCREMGARIDKIFTDGALNTEIAELKNTPNRFSQENLRLKIVTVKANTVSDIQTNGQADIVTMKRYKTAVEQLRFVASEMQTIEQNLQKLIGGLKDLETQLNKQVEQNTKVQVVDLPEIPEIYLPGINSQTKPIELQTQTLASPLAKDKPKANLDLMAAQTVLEVKQPIKREELEVRKLHDEMCRLHGQLENLTTIVNKILSDFSKGFEARSTSQSKDKPQPAPVRKSLFDMFSFTHKPQPDTSSEVKDKLENEKEAFEKQRAKLLQLIEQKDFVKEEILATDYNARIKLINYIAKLKILIENPNIPEAIRVLDVMFDLADKSDNKLKEFIKNTYPPVKKYIYEAMRSFVFELDAIQNAVKTPILSAETVVTLARISPDHPDAERLIADLLAQIQMECQKAGIDVNIVIARNRQKEIKDGSIQFQFSVNDAARMANIYKAMGHLNNKNVTAAEFKQREPQITQFIKAMLDIRWSDPTALEKFDQCCNAFDALTKEWEQSEPCFFAHPLAARPEFLKYARKDVVARAESQSRVVSENAAKLDKDRVCSRICP